jgi:hypothetical protein
MRTGSSIFSGMPVRTKIVSGRSSSWPSSSASTGPARSASSFSAAAAPGSSLSSSTSMPTSSSCTKMASILSGGMN